MIANSMVHHVSFDVEFRKNPYPGKIVVIEGIDGAGKTTQAKALVKKLNTSGFSAAYTKEPTDEVIGQFIREKILSGQTSMHPLALQYLFNADRVMHMKKIETLLQKGMIIIMDRYFWSAVAYAIADMEAIVDWSLTAFSILSFYHQFYLPDFTFYLTISPDDALTRIAASGKHTEIYDNEKKLLKIEKAYMLLIKKFPEAFTQLDANRKKEQVTDELYEKIVRSV